MGALNHTGRFTVGQLNENEKFQADRLAPSVGYFSAEARSDPFIPQMLQLSQDACLHAERSHI